MKFYAPKKYWNLPLEKREQECNGCGSELNLSGKLVPDTIYGLNIRQVCCIHDHMYIHGVTLGDKYFADAIFIMNLTVLILAKSSWWIKLPRMLRAVKYYTAVATAGDSSFFFAKTKNTAVNITFKGYFEDLSDVIQ